MPIPLQRSLSSPALVLRLLLPPVVAVVAMTGAAADEPSFFESLGQVNYFEQFFGHPTSLLEETIGPATQIRGPVTQDANDAISIAEEVEIQETPEGENRNNSRIEFLQRPLGEIEFQSAAPEGLVTPSTVALPSKPALYVSYSAHPVRPRNRYTIAAKHNPLYFEEPNLERCGNARGCAQSFLSAFHFFGNALALPYRVAERPWCTVEYDRIDCQTDGRLSCVEPLRPSGKGVALQAAVMTGIVFLLM